MLLILQDSKMGLSRSRNHLLKVRKRLLSKRIKTEINYFENIELFFKDGNIRVLVDGKKIDVFSLIFFRRVGEFRNLANIISNIAEKKHIQFFDKLYLTSNEPSKLKQAFILASNGLSIPKTYYSPVYNSSKISHAASFLKFPFVIKSSRGARGIDVYLVKTRAAANNILRKLRGKEIIIQEFIPNSFEYRLLVLGDRIAVTEKKIRSQNEEFKNNVCLGATEEFIDTKSVPLQARRAALKAAKACNIQIAGIDLVIAPNKKEYIFEVNRAPIFTNNEKISNEIKELADFLAKKYFIRKA